MDSSSAERVRGTHELPPAPAADLLPTPSGDQRAAGIPARRVTPPLRLSLITERTPEIRLCRFGALGGALRVGRTPLRHLGEEVADEQVEGLHLLLEHADPRRRGVGGRPAERARTRDS